MLQKAIDFATKAHEGQKYGSEPYINHPIRVYERVKAVTNDETVHVAAILHDVMEDCGVGLLELADEFGSDVAWIVDGLTRRKQSETYSDYLRKVAANPKATIIKLADLDENLGRKPHLTLEKRYKDAIAFLAPRPEPIREDGDNE
jgi:guanosine-3',5'-bis(diphosphate) 3'-pyrophosphohydrolase